jgi:hypothetical protein
MKLKGVDCCPLCKQPKVSQTPKVYTAQELMDSPPEKSEAMTLLCEALRILDREGTDAERACWRVADALWLLGEQFPHAVGIAERTGRRAMLSKPRRRKV